VRLLLPKEAYLQRVDANWRMMSPQGLEPPFAGQIALAVKIATFAMLHRTGLGFALDIRRSLGRGNAARSFDWLSVGCQQRPSVWMVGRTAA